MNKYYQAIINTSGDAKALSRVQVLDNTGDIVTIYADKSGTRFTDATGANVNYCEADATGMVEFYWTAASDQTLQVLDSTGELERSIADFANNFSEPGTAANVDAVIGVPAADGNLGTFTGSTIPDSSAVKPALQALETAGEQTASDVAARVPYTELASTAPGEGAALVNSLSPFPNSVARTLADRSVESRSVLEWFTDAQREAARAGDLSLNHTAAIQRAFDSGVPVLDMGEYLYRIDTTVNIPTTGIKVTGKGWRAQRGVGFSNNNGKMFSAVNPLGPIEFENGTITGNITEALYGPQAAGVWVENSSAGVTLRNFSSNNFALGSYMKYVDGYSVIGGSYKNNVLMGMSGIAKNVLIDGAWYEENGHDATGLTHDVYFLNGNAIVRNNTFVNHRDVLSACVVGRFDGPTSAPGYDECFDWFVHDNTFIGGNSNGVRINSDNTLPAAERKPARNINVYNNDLGGGELWFDDPLASKSWNNKNIGQYINRISSLFPGYPSQQKLTSINDSCERVLQGVGGTANISAANNLVIFDGLVASESPAFTLFPGSGVPKCAIINPIMPPGNAVFDTDPGGSFRNSYYSGRVDVQAATGSASRLNKTSVNWVTLNDTDVYDFDTAVMIAANSPHQLILNAAGASSITTMSGVDGQIAEFYFRTSGAAGASFTFPANVGLTAATASDLATGPAAGQRLALTLVYSDTRWREKYSSGWVA